MRVAHLIMASCILALSGAGVVFSHFGDPSRVLNKAGRSGAPISVASSASAGSGDVDSNQPLAPSAVGATLVTPSSAEPESGMPLLNEPGAPAAQEGAAGATLPTAPEESNPSNSPAPNQPVITPSASTEPSPAPPPRVVITV